MNHLRSGHPKGGPRPAAGPAREGAVARALRDRLGAAGPAYRVEAIPPDGAGSALVRVTLPDDGQPSGHEVRRWFDALPQSQFGVRFEVDRVARPADGPPALAIAAFSPGPGGQVMLRGGQVYQVGSGLDAGWRLEAVEGHEPRPVGRLTIRSANGVRLRLHRRAEVPAG